MAVNTGEIQPVARDVWLEPVQNRKDTRVIPPVAKTEGAVSSKVDNKAPKEEPNTSSNEGGEFIPPEVSEQVKEFLKQSNLQLNYTVDTKTGDSVVQVLNGETGEVIRQIPSHILVQFEEFRGVFFDNKV
jgi:flagellar protein FlaG